jgi:hypothetical protein
MLLGYFSWVLSFLVQFNPINIDSKSKDLSKFEYIIFDAGLESNIDDVLNSGKFSAIENKSINFGINDNLVWLKYDLINETDIEEKYLFINNPSLDSLDLYVVENGKVINHYLGGRLQDYDIKPIRSKSIIFKIDLPKRREVSLYLKVKSVNKKVIISTITDLDHIEEIINTENILFGIFSGVIIGLFFYNLFLYFSVKDKIYLIYVIHTVFVWLAQSSILGYTQELLWQDSVWLNLKSGVIFSSFVSIVGIWFLRVFLLTKHFIPKLDKGFYFIFFVYGFILVNAFFFSITISYQTLLVTQSIVVLYVLFTALMILRQGYGPARFYLLAWSVFMIGIFLFVMSEMGIIPINNFTAYIMPLGSALEVVLLSFALADKINILKKEKEEEQAERLRVLGLNEELIREQNAMLEEKVKIRTDELELALRNLQNTQSQLVSQEKMASLGQLTAGIAHEINNPINFVSSNITPLKRDIKDIEVSR